MLQYTTTLTHERCWHYHSLTPPPHQPIVQALGFAEADPTADVEGHDVQAKIALLAKLAFGKTVPWETVPTAGISQVDAVDFEYAKILKSTIKLVGTATLNDDSSLAVFVSPMMVPLGKYSQRNLIQAFPIQPNITHSSINLTQLNPT